MKSFKKYIKEGTGAVNTTMQSPDVHGDHGNNLAALENPNVVKALNAYVGALARQTHELPEQAINHIRQRLMTRVGLQFGATPVMEGNKGNFSLPLTLFGGRFGKDENTPFDEFINDDGISHKVEGGLKINFTYEMQEDNTCKITAKIA